MIALKDIEDKIYSSHKEDIIDGIMEMIFSIDNPVWVSNRLLELAENSDLDISGLAITGFGHLARMYSDIGDKDKVLKLLIKKLKNKDLQGRVQDVFDDLHIFMKITK